MFAWLAANAATILISAVLLLIVGLIIRGMIQGKVKTCGDCGSCGAGCKDGGCQACRFSESCRGGEKS
ncbi:MAG: hypothetical protein ACI3W7_07825 [Oscillospiraceae bacterium]